MIFSRYSVRAVYSVFCFCKIYIGSIFVTGGVNVKRL